MTSSDLENHPSLDSAGAILKEAREAAGLTIRVVADAIHLLPQQIEYIEADDYGQFNGDVFCKGYLKSYAVFLGLDPSPIIDAYKNQCPCIEKKLVSNSKCHDIQRPKKGGSLQYWFAAATVILGFLLWYVGSLNQVDNVINVLGDNEVIVDKNTSLVADIAVSKEIASFSEFGVIDDLVGGDDVPVSDANNPQQMIELTIDRSGNAASSVTYNESDLVSGEMLTYPQEENLLSFVFEEDCWVQVKDSDDNVLFAALKKANDTLTLNGKAPFNVLLGYGHGVSVNFNGEPVDFRVNKNTNSARLVVGQL